MVLSLKSHDISQMLFPVMQTNQRILCCKGCKKSLFHFWKDGKHKLQYLVHKEQDCVILFMEIGVICTLCTDKDEKVKRI